MGRDLSTNRLSDCCGIGERKTKSMIPPSPSTLLISSPMLKMKQVSESCAQAVGECRNLEDVQQALVLPTDAVDVAYVKYLMTKLLQVT